MKNLLRKIFASKMKVDEGEVKYAVSAMKEILNLTSQGVDLSQIADKAGWNTLQKLYEPSLFAEILHFQATSGAALYFSSLSGVNKKNFPCFSKSSSTQKIPVNTKSLGKFNIRNCILHRHLNQAQEEATTLVD